jgi:hypothetical protein
MLPRAICYIALWCVLALALAIRRAQTVPCALFEDVLRVTRQGGPESLV